MNKDLRMYCIQNVLIYIQQKFFILLLCTN